LGLTEAANFGAVRTAFCCARKEIHPDIFKHDEADHAFKKLGAAWDVWSSSLRPSQGSQAPSPPQASSAPSRPPATASSRPAPAQARAMGSAPSPTEDNIFRNYIFSLAPSDPAHGWAEALEFLSSKELAGELFELRSFNLITLNHLPQKLRTIFRDCFKRVLLLASNNKQTNKQTNFEENIRARDTLRQLARLLPTLILAHGDKVAMTRAKAFMMGDWKSLWNKCLTQGQARSDRLKKDPQTATTQSNKQVDVLAQK